WSHLENSHMMSSWAPERMNSCMSWRLRHTVIVQNSLGPATMLAQRTTDVSRWSWRRTRSEAIIIWGKNHGPRSRERVVTAKRVFDSATALSSLPLGSGLSRVQQAGQRRPIEHARATGAGPVGQDLGRRAGLAEAV